MSHIHEFLSTLPDSIFCFTYGSTFLSASTTGKNSSQIDLILCVDDPRDWHRKNMEMNPNHYYFASKYFGPQFIINSSEKAGKIHYNPYISYKNLVYKYGVISKKDLTEDLKF